MEFSDSKYLNVSDLERLTADELRIVRNEIYARLGRCFYYEDLEEYFDGKSWYEGTVEPDEFHQDVFNLYEAANVLLSKDYKEDIRDADRRAGMIMQV